MAVSLTPAAADRARTLLTEKGASWLRLAIRGGGCSGMMYHMDWVEAPQDLDKTFDCEGVQVCVDRKSYLYLNGTELDYEVSLVRQAFVFNNPMAERSCSCGESFMV